MSLDAVAARAALLWLLLPGIGIPVCLLAARNGRREFLPRLLVWFAIVPVFLGAAWLGPDVFLVLLLLAAVAACREISRLAAPGRRGATGPARLAAALLLALPWLALARWTGDPPLAGLAAVAVLPALRSFRSAPGSAGRRGWLALSLGAGLAFWVLLARRPEGFRPVLFAFSVVSVADILAFTAGRLLPRGRVPGGPSPGKTATGYLGAAAGALGAGALLRFALPELGWPEVLLGSLLLAAAGAAGDLLGSAVKRDHGLKDFGRLLGPIGGVLDRLDSLLGAGWIFHLYLVWRLGI